MCTNEDPETGTLNDAKLDDVVGGLSPRIASLGTDDESQDTTLEVSIPWPIIPVPPIK